nr:PREDICTED: serum response factor-binding protein 1 [Latimeria chalumnae]|eukprot:XP_014350734.1 PREDICTED: serum response factor-binding protein 1 [Latimeria chalumnae]
MDAGSQETLATDRRQSRAKITKPSSVSQDRQPWEEPKLDAQNHHAALSYFFSQSLYLQELKPDQVTKAALQKNISFDAVSKKPNSTSAERAIARVVSHPLISKKIADIKASIKAFKEARQKPSAGQKPQESKLGESATLEPSQLAHDEFGADEENTEQPTAGTLPGSRNKKEKVKHDASLNSSTTVNSWREPAQKSVVKEELSARGGSLECVAERESRIQDDVQLKTVQFGKQHEVIVCKKSQEKATSENDSSGTEESGDEEKEYFDDSTEERFYNQSSGTENSGDDDDDFFIGKVRRTKKKRMESDSASHEEKQDSIQSSIVNVPKGAEGETRADTECSKQNLKQMKLKSMFCGSLSGSKVQKKKDKKGKPQLKGKVNKTAVIHTNPRFSKPPPPTKAQTRTSKDKFLQSQQPIHPSWEASRKLKEQQSQITAFQGKKIRFDD